MQGGNIPPIRYGVGLPIAAAGGQYAAVPAKPQRLVLSGNHFGDFPPAGNFIFAVAAVTGGRQQFGFHRTILVQEINIMPATANRGYPFADAGGPCRLLRLPTLDTLPQQGQYGGKVHRRTEIDNTFRGSQVGFGLLKIDGRGIGKVPGQIGDQLLALQFNGLHIFTEDISAVVSRPEHPQIAVLVQNGQIPPGNGGKVPDLLAEAVGGDNIGILPAEKVSGNGIPRLAAQKASGDFAKGDPGGNAVGIVPHQRDLLHPFPGALETFIFPVKKGNGAVFLQQVSHRAAMARQSRADDFLHLIDAVQHRKGAHRAEDLSLAEGTKAVGIPVNTADPLPFGSRGKRRGFSEQADPAVGGKRHRGGRTLHAVIVDAQIAERFFAAQRCKKLLPLRGKPLRSALLCPLHRPGGSQAHLTEVIPVGKGIRPFRMRINGVQRIKQFLLFAAEIRPADEQDAVQRRVLCKLLFHCALSPALL